jgi:hypothetical protein
MLFRGTLAGLAALLLTTACSPGTPDLSSHRSEPVGRVPPRQSGQRYVVDLSEQQLVTYDERRGNVVAVSDEEGFYYYGFRMPSHLYTSGNNRTHGFSILSIDRDAVRTVSTMPTDEDIFPLATRGEVSFFTTISYDEHGDESERRLVRLASDGTLQTYHSFAGPRELLDHGAILRGRLYYTVYNQIEDDDTLFSIPVDRPDATPRVERTGLASGEVYAHLGTLLTSDGTTISGGGRRFTCQDLCWFYDDPAMLVMITIEKGSLVLKVIDSRDGTTVTSVPGTVGFDVARHLLTVETTTGIKRVDLAKVLS